MIQTLARMLMLGAMLYGSIVGVCAQHRLLVVGDSISVGFPMNDEVSYQTVLGELLSPITYAGDPVEGYDLVLESVTTTGELTATGTQLVVIALVDGALHVRIFDGNGDVAVDEDESGLSQPASVHDNLKAFLEQVPFPDASAMTALEKRVRIEQAAELTELLSLTDTGQPMIGGNGNIIGRTPPAPFNSRRGAQDHFERIEGMLQSNNDVPDYIVVLLGVNDMIELIAPHDSDDTFVPGTVAGDFPASGGALPSGNDDFTDGGIFVDHGVDLGAGTYGEIPTESELHVVEPLIDRYETFLDVLAAAFPTAHFLLVPIPSTDAAGGFGDASFQSAKVTLKAMVDVFNPQLAALAESRGSQYTCVDPMLIRAINTTDPDSPPQYIPSPDLRNGDGLHPSAAGYEKIGRALANAILYRDWAADAFGSDFGDPAKEASVWGRKADPDADGWTNELEYYEGRDPNAYDELMLEIAVSGNDFTVTFEKHEDVLLESVRLEYSTDLTEWTTDGLSVPMEGVPTNDILSITETLTLDPWDSVFFRLTAQGVH